MAERYEFHDELLPICLLGVKQTLGVADVQPIFDHYRSLCRRGVKFVAVSDVRAAEQMPDAATRAKLGEAAARFAFEAKPWSLGSAIVVSSPIIRGALVAVEWISRPATPTSYFSELTDAMDWAVAKLEATHLPVSRTIRDYRQRLQDSARRASRKK